MKVENKLIQRVVLVVTLGLVFPNAQAEEIVEKLKVGGTFLTSRIDANMDNEASSWCTLHIKGGVQGSSMQQCVNEDVTMAPTADCPGGVAIVDSDNGIGTGRGVRTFAKGIDQLFLELTERYLCVDIGPEGPFFKDSYDRGVITGGTGKFAGATGTYEYLYTGTVHYGDLFATPPQFFGSVSGTGTTTIIIPD